MCYHVSTPGQLELTEQLPDYSVEAKFDPIYHVSGFTRPFLPITTNANPQLIEAGDGSCRSLDNFGECFMA